MKHDVIQKPYHPTDCGCGRCRAAHPVEVSRTVRYVLWGAALGWLAGAVLTVIHYAPAILAALS